jgi:hypothetical protein
LELLSSLNDQVLGFLDSLNDQAIWGFSNHQKIPTSKTSTAPPSTFLNSTLLIHKSPWFSTSKLSVPFLDSTFVSLSITVDAKWAYLSAYAFNSGMSLMVSRHSWKLAWKKKWMGVMSGRSKVPFRKPLRRSGFWWEIKRDFWILISDLGEAYSLSHTAQLSRHGTLPISAATILTDPN